MLENATRPYIVAMYETFTLPNGMARCVVIKNCGQGVAEISKIECGGVENERFLGQIALLKGASLAPGQKMFYHFGTSDPYHRETLEISLGYTDQNGKLYTEHFLLNMITGTTAMRSRDSEAIPMALQEIADRLL